MNNSPHWQKYFAKIRTLDSALKARALPLDAIPFLLEDIKQMRN